MRSNIVGLSVLMLWSLGFLVPYTLIGFMGILLIILFLNLLLNKILKMNFIKTKQYESASIKINLDEQL